MTTKKKQTAEKKKTAEDFIIKSDDFSMKREWVDSTRKEVVDFIFYKAMSAFIKRVFEIPHDAELTTYVEAGIISTGMRFTWFTHDVRKYDLNKMNEFNDTDNNLPEGEYPQFEMAFASAEWDYEQDKEIGFFDKDGVPMIKVYLDIDFTSEHMVKNFRTWYDG